MLHTAAALAPRPDRQLPQPAGGFVVGGEVARNSGLGEAARLTRQALAEAGVAVATAGRGGDMWPAAAPLIMHGTAPGMAWALLRLGRARVRGRKVIGYWPWELPVVPPSWRVGAEFVHELWAPSRFTAAAFAGLGPSVRVVPHPVAIRPPRPSALGRADFGLSDSAFVTLVRFNLASSLERKNPFGAIAAHRAAFGNRPDRVLLLHVTNPHHFPADFARLAVAADGPNIRLHTDEHSRADAEAMVASCDVLLSLHRSEGFGLVPAEAMMQGKPVVATNWSGTTEYMDADSAALVPARLVEARDERGVYAVPGAVWAEPDVEAAADWLQRLAADPALCWRLGAAGQRTAQAKLGPELLLEAVRAQDGSRD